MSDQAKIGSPYGHFNIGEQIDTEFVTFKIMNFYKIQIFPPNTVYIKNVFFKLNRKKSKLLHLDLTLDNYIN